MSGYVATPTALARRPLHLSHVEFHEETHDYGTRLSMAAAVVDTDADRSPLIRFAVSSSAREVVKPPTLVQRKRYVSVQDVRELMDGDDASDGEVPTVLADDGGLYIIEEICTDPGEVRTLTMLEKRERWGQMREQLLDRLEMVVRAAALLTAKEPAQ